MNKFFIIGIVLLFIFGGCVLDRTGEVWDFQFDHNITAENLWEAYSWVVNNVVYKEDVEGNYWQSPEETYNLRTGDCEDLSIMFMYLACSCIGCKPELCIVNTLGMQGHAVVKIDDYYYDVTRGFWGWETSLNFVWYSEPYLTFSCGETMWKAITNETP